jgi:MinD-like ATPase involved in chromosome partitioning or flagellar assembly
MDKKSYTILTAAQKGGVGKTVVAINITTALRTAGYEVLLIDTDVANPSVGPLLGMRDTGPGYADIVQGKSKVEETQIVYEPTGFYIIPAGGSGTALNATAEQLNKFYSQITKLNFDFVIVDTPPGVDLGGALKNFDEALIVTTPEETSVFGAQKLSQLYGKNHLLHKLVINRIKDDKFELDEEKVEQIYGDIAYGMLPEDRSVIESESKHIPAYLLNRSSEFSQAIDELCRAYTLKAGEPDQGGMNKSGFGGVKRFFGMK